MSKKSKIITTISVFLVLVLLAVAIYFAVPKVLDKTWAEIFKGNQQEIETPDEPDNDTELNFVQYFFSYNIPTDQVTSDFPIIYASSVGYEYLNEKYSNFDNLRGQMIAGERVRFTFSVMNPQRLVEVKVYLESIPFTVLDDTHVQIEFTVPKEDFHITLKIDYEGINFN